MARKWLTKSISVLLVAVMLITAAPLSGLVGLEIGAYSTNVKNNIKIGEYLTLGTYYGEPIVWRCVAINENGPLMLSDRILCLKAFDASGDSTEYHSDGWGYVRKNNGSNCWEDSNIRQWLNCSGKVEYSHCPPTASGVSYNAYDSENGFLTGFSAEELSYISNASRIINLNEWETHREGYCDGGSKEIGIGKYIYPEGTDYKSYYYKVLSDLVFLLNASECSEIERNLPGYLKTAYPTESAVVNSNYKNSKLSSTNLWYYGIAVPENSGASYENYNIVHDGSFCGGYFCSHVNDGSVGVRPAFYLSGEKQEFQNRIIANYLDTALSVVFDGEFFSIASKSYSHDIAKFASDAVLSGYQSEESANRFLKTFGFDTDKMVMKKNTSKYDVDTIVTSRKIRAGADEYTLVLVELIGSHDDQWYSNFDPANYKGNSQGYNVSVHQGFLGASEFAYKQVSDYFKAIGQPDKAKTKFLICGHSRGAAAANLLSVRLTDENKWADNNNIYTYAFATPNSAKNENNYSKAKRSDSVYNNIFNIVNPEDFVTKLLPSAWGFGRFGVTYTLPSRTQTCKNVGTCINYNDYANKMNNLVYSISEQEYTPYSKGEKSTYDNVKSFTSKIGSLEDFYNKELRIDVINKTTPYQFFTTVLCPFVANKDSKDAIMCLIDLLNPMTFSDSAYTTMIMFFLSSNLAEFTKDSISDIDKLKDDLINNYTNSLYFSMAHKCEMYCAAVNLLTKNAIQQYRAGYKGTINCPVDIEIYDKGSNELVCNIVNNEVNKEIAEKENSLVAEVDGDSKSFWLPSLDDYDIRLIGNDEGIMDCSFAKINSENSIIEEQVNYFDVPVANGFTYSVVYDDGNSTLGTQYLQDDDSGEIKPTQTLETDDTNKLSIAVYVEGNGCVDGCDKATSGEYVSLVAMPEDGNCFLGWYDEENCISTDLQYGFVAKNDVTIVAKFSMSQEHNEHISAPADHENEIPATCTRSGSFDEVIYCSVCGEEISRVNKAVDKLSHQDSNSDGKCDTCGKDLGTHTPTDPSANCSCRCHKSGFQGFIYKIILIFWKIFKLNRTCACGVAHY